MNNAVNQNEQILEQVKKMMLEQQVSELGNSLSNTISFFSMTLAAGAIVFAIVIAILSWVWNRVFNEKSKKVEDMEINVNNELVEVKRIKRETDKKFIEIKDMYNEIQNLKQKLETTIEENQSLKLWNDYLEERINIAENNRKFMELIYEIENKLRQVTQNNIMKFYTDKQEGNPQAQFNYHKRFYLDAKKDVVNLNNIEYSYFDFKEDIDEGEEFFRSSDILGYYAEAEGFLNELNEILKRV
ncbi:hypothetical protein [Bacillus cereus]